METCGEVGLGSLFRVQVHGDKGQPFVFSLSQLRCGRQGIYLPTQGAWNATIQGLVQFICPKPCYAVRACDVTFVRFHSYQGHTNYHLMDAAWNEILFSHCKKTFLVSCCLILSPRLGKGYWRVAVTKWYRGHTHFYLWHSWGGYFTSRLSTRSDYYNATTPYN